MVFLVIADFLLVIALVFISNNLQASAQQQLPPPQQQLPPQQQQLPPQQQQQLPPPQQQQLPPPQQQQQQQLPPPQQQQQLPPPPPQQQGPPSGQQIGGNGDNVIATGTINSVLFTGPTNWIATGNWNMKVEDGELEEFVTRMTWYNTNGTMSHTHEIQNFSVENDDEITLTPGNTISLNGESDVGTNGNINWEDVPTTIKIGGGTTLSILLDDEETDNHFARQPMYGVVTSMSARGDEPGPNMQVLPPC